jgi:hypothetical protein
MEPTPPESTNDPIYTSPTGALYRAVNMVRDVKIYPIQEHELTTLGVFSTIVTVSASVASLTIGFLLSIWWDMSASTNAAQLRIGKILTGVSAVIVVACFLAATWAVRFRKSELQKILTESRVIGVTDTLLK